MKQFSLKHRKWLLYTLYGVLLAAALLVFRFPSDALMDYIQAELHNKYPNLLVSVQKVSLSFPIGLKFTGAELITQAPPEQIVFSAKKIIIRPKLMSLLGRNPQYRFSCQAYDGTITGQADIIKIGEEISFNLSTEFINIHIDENSPLPAYIKDYFSGIMEGTVTFSGSGLFDPEGTGEAALTLSNGSFKFAQPLLNINVIDFEELPVKAELKDQNLNISSARLKGKDFLGQASGLISLKSPVKESRLNIKLNIEPTAAFMQDSSRNDSASNLIKQVLKNGRTFNIKGTIENPSF
jgi:type II secretion system protein N